MSNSTDFDVTIIGAGPTGAMAAIRLASFGFSVLVIDRVTFPRVKPCGGGLTIKTLNALPYSVGPVIRSATKAFAIGVKSADRQRLEQFEGEDHICAFVVREQFDKFNFDKMIAARVDFEVNSGLEAIAERPGSVELHFGNKTIRSKYLIGADGANSTVRRLVAPHTHFHRGFAIEGLVPVDKIDRIPDPEFLFGVVGNGYGWLFPKGDHINVGIYTHDERARLSKDLLRDYCRARLGRDGIEHIVGFPLGFGGRQYSPASDRIFLAGDAAGFVEPFFGEGLHNAIKSGLVVADAIHAAEAGKARSAGTAYRKAIAPLLSDLRRCDHLKAFFYRNMHGIGFNLATLRMSKLAMLKGFAAGKTMRELTNQFVFSPLFRPSRPASLIDFLAAGQASG